MVTGDVQAQSSGGGISVTCDAGGSFDNGVEFIVNQMRPGFSYTATAIGLNGFDPVLAVLDTSTGNGLCSDDTAEAAVYQANLPSTGAVPASNRSAQVVFSQTAGQMADVSLVVGGFGNSTGEFLLILEGMAATAADGAGDPFSVRLTPALVESSVPLSVYMLAITSNFDPYFYLAGSNLQPITDDSGSAVACDDAGGACWGESASLVGSFVSRTRNRQVPGGQYDAMLQVPMSEFAGLDFDAGPWYLTFVMTSYQQRTFGDYVIAFHGEVR